MNSNGFDLYADITNRIVAAIEEGAGEFQMPWHRAAALHAPVNAATGKRYRGVNILSLWITAEDRGYATAEWATFNQWRGRDAQVRKGEKGTPIVFYKTLDIAGDSNDGGESQDRKIPFARASWVFNAEQVDGYEPTTTPAEKPSEFQLIESAERVIAATGADIRHGGLRAFYHRVEDRIQLPEPGSFIGTATSTPCESYYSTKFHEASHWSGAPHRLNREKGKRFADKPYCFEEIIAELGAAFACARLGIQSTPRADHAQYIEQYLKLLKEDKRAIFSAATAASAAVDYIFAFSASEGESKAA